MAHSADSALLSALCVTDFSMRCDCADEIAQRSPPLSARTAARRLIMVLAVTDAMTKPMPIRAKVLSRSSKRSKPKAIQKSKPSGKIPLGNFQKQKTTVF